MIDAIASAALFTTLAAGGIAWLALARNVRFERVARAGAGLLGETTQTAAYWAIQPLARLLVRHRISANAITLASLPLAVGAAVAFAQSHHGVGAVLALACFGCDALDGLVARATDTASPSGEILDATVDRLCEAVIFAGLTIAWRASVPVVALVAAAALGAQQVTLASAKAEVHPWAKVPRGAMRRAERAAALVLGTAGSGLLEGRWFAAAPTIVALSMIAVVGNASALHRFWVLATALRRHGDRAEEIRHAAE